MELVSTSLAACCVAACAQGWHAVSARLAQSGCQALALCTGSRCAAQVQLLIAEYNVAHCSWAEAAECFEEAMEIFVDLGDNWRAGIAKDGLRWVEHIQTNYYELAQTSTETADGPSMFVSEDTPDAIRTVGPQFDRVVAESGGQADHYAIIDQVYAVRRTWSCLLALPQFDRMAATSSSRTQVCAELGSLFPAEFIFDLLDNQLGRDSHGLSGVLALCAAELAAIYAYWLMEDASSFGHENSSPPRATPVRETSSRQHSRTENRPAQARAESYRVLVLASGLMDSLTFPTARALPALVAVSQGWLRFVERWGAGKQRKHRHRRHSVDHSLLSQPPPSPLAVLGETPSMKALSTSARSLDADGSLATTPDRMRELSAAHSTSKKHARRVKRETVRRLSVPEWRSNDDVHAGDASRTRSPLALDADRATHSGATSVTVSSGGVVVELELPTRIPAPTRRRGNSGGSSASGSEATPLVGTTSRAPPPPSPLARAAAPTASRDASGHIDETAGSGIGSLLPPLHSTVSSVSTTPVPNKGDETRPAAAEAPSSAPHTAAKEAAADVSLVASAPGENQLRTASINSRQPPLASIRSVDGGETASSSEDEMPLPAQREAERETERASEPIAKAQPTTSPPLLLRLKSEFNSDDDEEDGGGCQPALNSTSAKPAIKAAIKPEPEPEPEPVWAYTRSIDTPTGRHASSAAATMQQQAREALLRHIASAGDHVSRVTRATSPEAIPVCTHRILTGHAAVLSLCVCVRACVCARVCVHCDTCRSSVC